MSPACSTESLACDVYRFLFDPDRGERDPTRGEFSARLRLPAARDPAELGEALTSGWVCFDPWKMFPGDGDSAFDFFCRYAFELCGCLPGEKILVIDEVWRYCSPNSILWLARCVKEGRKRGLRVLVNVQEPHRLTRKNHKPARLGRCRA